MKKRKRDTLLSQILAVNVFVVTATLFAATLAAGLDISIAGQRRQFLILAMAIGLTLLVNILMLRRRFNPLERLIDEVESIDPSKPEGLDATASGVEEVERLGASFSRLLDRIAAERNRSSSLVLRAQEAERRRLARDLHDEVNQSLTGVLLRLEALRQDAGPNLQRDLAETKALATQAMEELLQLARQLRPTALDDHGLVPAIDGQARRFSEQTGITVEFEPAGEFEDMDSDRQITIYRIAQEALSNVARHSSAERVTISLANGQDGSVALSVSDDGEGFASARNGSGGLGLGGMSERARLVGGNLSVDSRPGHGTRVLLRIPEMAEAS